MTKSIPEKIIKRTYLKLAKFENKVQLINIGDKIEISEAGLSLAVVGVGNRWKVTKLQANGMSVSYPLQRTKQGCPLNTIYYFIIFISYHITSCHFWSLSHLSKNKTTTRRKIILKQKLIVVLQIPWTQINKNQMTITIFCS